MRGLFDMTGVANMAAPKQRMAPDPTRMLMDVGTTVPHSLTLLEVYDSQGTIANSNTAFGGFGNPVTINPPAGTTKAVIRVVGTAGGGTGTDTGFGSNPRTIHVPGASGGAFAKVTINNTNPSDVYQTVTSWGGNTGGLGIAINNTVVCYADCGSFSASDTGHAGGSAGRSLGDITRSGGGGTGSGGGWGGDGDHGVLGSEGGEVTDGPNPPFTNQVDYTYYGGSGGQGGDFGDPDGVGFGWNPATGVRFSAQTGTEGQRWTIHFYGYS